MYRQPGVRTAWLLRPNVVSAGRSHAACGSTSSDLMLRPWMCSGVEMRPTRRKCSRGSAACRTPVCVEWQFRPGSIEPGNRLLLIGQTDGCCTGPFATLPDGVLDCLPLSKFFEGYALNFRMVEEQVISLAFNKTETTIRYQPLDLTLWHLCPPEKTSDLDSSRPFVIGEL